jgi:hypothetical protein
MDIDVLLYIEQENIIAHGTIIDDEAVVLIKYDTQGNFLSILMVPIQQ